jgi:hypothetical protein
MAIVDLFLKVGTIPEFRSKSRMAIGTNARRSRKQLFAVRASIRPNCTDGWSGAEIRVLHLFTALRLISGGSNRNLSDHELRTSLRNKVLRRGRIARR